jgi:hypothetical protein
VKSAYVGVFGFISTENASLKAEMGKLYALLIASTWNMTILKEFRQLEWKLFHPYRLQVPS